MGEKLKEEDAKKYKVISRILGIFMRIANVCCWIGVGALALTTIATAIIAPNVKIDREAKEISLFDKNVNYDFKDKEIELGEGKEKVVIRNNEIIVGEDGSVVSVKLSDNSIEEIERFIENDAMRFIAAFPYVIALATVAVVFSALALGHGASVFKNIAIKDTPFIKENVERCEKAAKYLIISVVITFIANFAMSLMTGASSTNFATGSITGILGIYVVIYVLKSGLALGTKKSDK